MAIELSRAMKPFDAGKQEVQAFVAHNVCSGYTVFWCTMLLH